MSASEGQVVRALGGIAGATLLSRVLGFVRDMVVARAFGAGPLTDAFFVAFRIPNILRRLLAEGALSTAMIPVFTDYVARDDRPALRRMLRAVLGLALLALTVTTALGIVFAPWVLNAIAPGFMDDPSQASLAATPDADHVPVSAARRPRRDGDGYSERPPARFFAGAIGPAVLNLGMIGRVRPARTASRPADRVAGDRRARRAASGSCSYSCRPVGVRTCWWRRRAICATPRSRGSRGSCCRRSSAWRRCR